jgi:hypothetical protein
MYVPNFFIVIYVPNFLIVMYVPFPVFCVLFVCKCLLYYCHRVSIQLQLNISSSSSPPNPCFSWYIFDEYIHKIRTEFFLNISYRKFRLQTSRFLQPSSMNLKRVWNCVYRFEHRRQSWNGVLRPSMGRLHVCRTVALPFILPAATLIPLLVRQWFDWTSSCLHLNTWPHFDGTFTHR